LKTSLRFHNSKVLKKKPVEDFFMEQYVDKKLRMKQLKKLVCSPEDIQGSKKQEKKEV
jgi:hypothetical protein